MIALWILGILAALLGLLCCVPVGITGEYGQSGASLTAHIGPVSLRIYPRPVKTKDKKDRKSRKKAGAGTERQTQLARKEQREARQQEKTAKKAEKARKTEQAKREKNKQSSEKSKAIPSDAQTPQEERGGGLELFRQIVGLVLEFQADLRNRLHVRQLVLRLRIGAKDQDPAQSAVLYGSAWAALGNLTTVLQRAFRIHDQDTRAEIDFLEEHTTVYAKAHLTMTVGAILKLAGYYGLRGLKLYRTQMKKGGSEYGTSN